MKLVCNIRGWRFRDGRSERYTEKGQVFNGDVDSGIPVDVYKAFTTQEYFRGKDGKKVYVFTEVPERNLPTERVVGKREDDIWMSVDDELNSFFNIR